MQGQGGDSTALRRLLDESLGGLRWVAGGLEERGGEGMAPPLPAEGGSPSRFARLCICLLASSPRSCAHAHNVSVRARSPRCCCDALPAVSRASPRCSFLLPAPSCLCLGRSRPAHPLPLSLTPSSPPSLPSPLSLPLKTYLRTLMTLVSSLTHPVLLPRFSFIS